MKKTFYSLAIAIFGALVALPVTGIITFLAAVPLLGLVTDYPQHELGIGVFGFFIGISYCVSFILARKAVGEEEKK